MTVLELATHRHVMDALWLHDRWLAMSMSHRDAFLCGYLHEAFGESSPVDRLLRAAFELPVDQVPSEVRRRWAVVLVWFGSAADRRVRDHATKALVAITTPEPGLSSWLVESFVGCDDDAVLERCVLAAYGTLLRTLDADACRDVAALLLRTVFNEPERFANALVRDHARGIVDLAHHLGVLSVGVAVDVAQPPYRSPWPLELPSDEEVDGIAKAPQFPKLHRSCLQDDFFHYTLGCTHAYNHAVTKIACARWILREVVLMGYGHPLHAEYDREMLNVHGGGRGRPRWAERIGKKYQRIALARLMARLTDNVDPRRDWPVRRHGPGLTHPFGRDLDPSIIVRSPQREKIGGSAWWIRRPFVFSDGEPDPAWALDRTDIPDLKDLLEPVVDASGVRWQPVQQYFTWSGSRARDPAKSTSQRYRDAWAHVRGYIVARRHARRVFRWLSEQHFVGRWMPEGAELSGMVGEYPFAAEYVSETSWKEGKDADRALPSDLVPVANSMTASFDDDAFQEGPLHLELPTPLFFEPLGLRWDGASGYRTRDGRPAFVDPSMNDPGPSTLLMAPSVLEFLREQDLALVWTTLGEKRIMGVRERLPDTVFNQVALLQPDGKLIVSAIRFDAQPDSEE